MTVTRPSTTDERIEALMSAQNEALVELRRMASEEAHCQHRYEQSFAIALLRVDTDLTIDNERPLIKMTEARRKAIAETKTSTERLEYLLAKNLFVTQRVVLATMSSQAELLRTLSANNRSVFGP